jgi:hypothetical protein
MFKKLRTSLSWFQECYFGKFEMAIPSGPTFAVHVAPKQFPYPSPESEDGELRSTGDDAQLSPHPSGKLEVVELTFSSEKVTSFGASHEWSAKALLACKCTRRLFSGRSTNTAIAARVSINFLHIA